MRSDQGTNIVGAERELKKAPDELDHNTIQRSLRRVSIADWIIQWKQNPPAASHMPSLWERQIRSVRSILSALMREHGQAVDDESFRTLLTEVACIINSRPLTVPSSDPEDRDPLRTPNHILTMKSRVVMPPPGNFQKADCTSVKDGNVCSIFRMSFGRDGERSTSKIYNSEVETSPKKLRKGRPGTDRR